jgi:hypothetical protein
MAPLEMNEGTITVKGAQRACYKAYVLPYPGLNLNLLYNNTPDSSSTLLFFDNPEVGGKYLRNAGSNLTMNTVSCTSTT